MRENEILRELIKKDGKPIRQLKQYEAFGLIFGDPIMGYLMEGFTPGAVYKDKWGVTIQFPLGAPGPMPLITSENKVLKDITQWKDIVHAPDIEQFENADWSFAQEFASNIQSTGKLSMCLMGTGIFEELHYLMGFEDTLTNLYEYPQQMHELIDYILKYRLTYAKMLIEHLHPDAILSHDDWGTKDALFMQPDIWREFFKEPYRKFYGYIKSQGVIILHHADSYLAPIVEDMAEIGIDIWQGALPENNIPKLLEQLNGSMTLMGGIGAAIDRQDSTEEEIRAYVKNVLETCCPLGHFIPCITYGLAGTVYKHVDPIIDDEIDKYNNQLHLQVYHSDDVVHLQVHNTAVEKDNTESESTDSIFYQIAQATRKGQKKKTVNLIQQGLQENVDPLELLNKGLVVGMNEVGTDFSQNKVFIPEMLMAAKSMNAATEILKPYLSQSSNTLGKACIGTVQGDMHDIGKNLVKIMMESSGIEVIDLGTDVSAECFINTAIQHNCDIICCSALLTTTMSHIPEVVSLAKEKDIRDQVAIMIGGAPITQQFCDEVGADIYTDDAGSAAKEAVKYLLSRK